MSDFIDYQAELALIRDRDERDKRIAKLEAKLAASEAKCAELEKQRDASVHLSRCECGPEELCLNLIKANGRADRAEKVAVWAVKRSPAIRLDHRGWFVSLVDNTVPAITFDGTDADILRALFQAMEGE